MKKVFTYMLLLSMSALTFISPASAINPSSLPTETTTTTAEPTLGDAFKEFKSLSRKEKKERFRAVKKAMKEFKTEKKAGAEPSTNTLLLVVLAILLPPLAVYLHEGTTNKRFWISLLLTLLFWIPGVIYALIVVLGD
jgi:uncharacterized membrane protein YqaE (UPF0057 family)